MHVLFGSANDKTHDVIGSAIEVHKDKGPGLLESKIRRDRATDQQGSIAQLHETAEYSAGSDYQL